MKKIIRISVFAAVMIIVSAMMLTVSTAKIQITDLPIDEELLYGRGTLAKMDNGEELVAIYDTIVEGVQSNRDIIPFGFLNDLGIEVTVSEIEMVNNAVRYDNPQFFWVEGFSYSYYPSTQVVPEAFVYYFDDVNNAQAKAEFEGAAKQFIVDAGVTTDMSEYEISLRLHDAVVNHIEYDLGAPNAHNAYGALIGGKAVCEGYAELYQYLLYLCGIQSHAVVGYADGDHMWNLVKIDGDYYMSDPTWDDPSDNNTGRIFYEYMNVTTDKLLSEGRSIEEVGYPLPSCTATKANYYNYHFYNMNNFKDQPSLENAITQLKYYGEARFHYNGSGTYSFSEFQTWCGENIGSMISELTFKAGVTQISYSCLSLTSEYILIITDVDTSPLPVIEDIPNIAAICVDTAVSVMPNSAAGDVAICPVISGNKLSVADIQELLNNTAIEVKGLKNGYVATGSKLVFGNEEAVIAVKGDIDGDGELSVFDANMARKGQSNFPTGYELQKMASDVDGNTITDKNDSKAIVNQIVS